MFIKSNVFNVHGSAHPNNILIYIQQDATLHSLFYLETALHVLGGTTTHHQERKQLYLQHLVFVRPLLVPAAIATGSSSTYERKLNLKLAADTLATSYPVVLTTYC
jgi:hypothetical protein